MIRFFKTEEGLELSKIPEIATIAERFQDGSQDSLKLGDLHYLHEAYPQKFKDIYLLTASYPDGQPVVLSSQYTPQVDLAEACHASSAIPVLASTVKIKIDDREYILFDGGYLRFLPTEFLDFHDGEYCNLHPESTLVVALSNHEDKEQTSIHKALHGEPPYYTPPFLEKMARQYAPGLFSGIKSPKNNVENWEDNYAELSKYRSSQVIILDTHEVVQNEFDKATFWCKELAWLGYYDTIIHFYREEIELSNASISIREFMNSLAYSTICIYRALFTEANTDIFQDDLYSQLSDITDAYEICEIFRHYIRINKEEKLDSLCAFAFTRAIEFINKQINDEALFKEAYARIHFPERSLISLDFTGLFVKNLNEKRTLLTCPELDQIYREQEESIDFEVIPFKLMLNELHSENKRIVPVQKPLNCEMQ